MTTRTSGTYRADNPTSEALMIRNASLNRASMKMGANQCHGPEIIPSSFAVAKLNPGFLLLCAACSGSLMPRASTATAIKGWNAGKPQHRPPHCLNKESSVASPPEGR
jgi:hypothetical protein